MTESGKQDSLAPSFNYTALTSVEMGSDAPLLKDNIPTPNASNESEKQNNKFTNVQLSQNIAIAAPPELEYLSTIDQLLVHQQIELLEVITGCEIKNKYRIRNTVGQDVYFAAEESDCCDRYWCGQIRSFDMKIFDNLGHQVLHFFRPLACQGCCFPCCLQSLEVSTPAGNLLGVVEQEWSIFLPSFRVKNANEDVVFKINGPCCTCSCGNDVNFNITTADGGLVGTIAKQWSGFCKEAFTDAG